jgi:hypothetical protein
MQLLSTLTYAVPPDLDRTLSFPFTFMHINCMDIVRSVVGDMIGLGLPDTEELLRRGFEFYDSLQLTL